MLYIHGIARLLGLYGIIGSCMGAFREDVAWPYEEQQAEVAVQFAILDPDSTPVRCALLHHWRSSCQHAVSSCRLFCDRTVDHLSPAHLILRIENHNIQLNRVTDSDCPLKLGEPI